MPSFINRAGQRYGRLLAIERRPSDTREVFWTCKCDCGNNVITTSSKLGSGHTQSCGCLMRERSAQSASALVRHGHTAGPRNKPVITRTYASWRAMKTRCTNPKTDGYHRYGGRGVRFCPAWNEFEKFLADMGERPTGTTLDRHPNPDGNYEPGNCRWATPAEQANNKGAK